MYPTGEQLARLKECVSCESCDGGDSSETGYTDCSGCDIDMWCGDNNPDLLEAMEAMHDALDAKQSELDKAHDLIRRIVENDKKQATMEFPLWWNELNSIMEEAEAMLNEKQAQT